MASCPQGTPKWEVEGERCARVPVPASEDERKLDLSLASRYFFSPVFFLEEAQVQLGTSAGGSVTASGARLSPLPPSTQRVVLSFVPDGGKVSVKVLMADEMLHMLTLRKDPREVKVCGRRSTKFMLVLNLETKRTKKEPAVFTEINSCPTKLMMEYVIGGMGALVVMLVACLAVSLFRRSHANQARRGSCARRRPASRSSPEDPHKPAAQHLARPNSAYLEPRAGVPWAFPAGPRISSSPEHIYEEVDDDAGISSRASSCSQDFEGRLSNGVDAYVNAVK
ncbi:uncharacterized protein LOC134769821 [Penaeus indicus]|uniref:uncharacterized protein LOC134769821 n=1 Tax=Penaeus indicus TaxID=29960 RepID=UPI00300CED52